MNAGQDKPPLGASPREGRPLQGETFPVMGSTGMLLPPAALSGGPAQGATDQRNEDPRNANLLNAEKRGSLSSAAVESFLASVANSTLKVRILQFFAGQPGVCLSSTQLAQRIQAHSEEVKQALQELSNDGALTFCAHFGYGDLCLMNPNYHTTAMKRDLKLLQQTLNIRPEEVWQYFGE